MNAATAGVRMRTRQAILEAVADVITETQGVGFSVQAVADRAGLSHRTIYNHFPTRDALCEAFADYVDELLTARGMMPELEPSLDSVPAMVEALYRTLELRDRYVRASVMLMIANRRPLASWRSRTRMFESWVARDAGPRTPLPARQVTAALRMFASSMGWHLLTEQFGLSTSEAAETSVWATTTLLTALTREPARASSSSRVRNKPAPAIRNRKRQRSR